MSSSLPPAFSKFHISNFSSTEFSFAKNSSFKPQIPKRSFRISGNSDKFDTPALLDEAPKDVQVVTGDVVAKEERENEGGSKISAVSSSAAIEKDLKNVVNKTASTFAPRASTARKNPAVPGTALYTIFEIQGYASMLLGGALSFNIIFPSNEPDIWRLMGMWSIWMFTIPSLRARDCSKKEKEALNYLFLLIPLLNVIIPFFWKSFAVVWSADTIAFFLMYAWKLGLLQKTD
ncbi:hypothetical protein Nepgr_027827 [Nepenthes gracilis]|uniref:Protein RESISTANCE TO PHYTOPHTHORA 1, chloroplastic n=1 Tax=Nepenthes gracilis TaxID=150966 RepID=A0AAD3TBM6_NEPGR|nr:hypothetical protein Nepgr_027827 [Nepenthes gracilis]